MTAEQKGKELIIEGWTAYDYVIHGQPVPESVHNQAMDLEKKSPIRVAKEAPARGSPFQAPMTSFPRSGFK